MADFSDHDLIPVKEAKTSTSSHVQYDFINTHALDRAGPLEKKIAEQLSRNELEDQLYKLKDENLELKKTFRKQEDQLKKMSTKVSRLINEKKKLEVNTSPGRKRDLEVEEAIEQLQDKVRSLEKSNVQLREKLLVAKQQVITHARRPNPYHHIPPKVQTGRPRSGISPYSLSTSLQNIQRKATPIPPFVMQLLEEARNELFVLKDQTNAQRNEIEVLEQENEITKERLRIKDAEFEEQFRILKSQIIQEQRQHVQENMDLIRLHRELKQKESKIVTLQAQFIDAEEKVKSHKGAQDRLVKQLEDKSISLREEQKKSLELFSELQKNKAALVNLTELQESLKILKKENDILKETNDQLIKSVINQEKDRSSLSLEMVLKEQISKLETSLNSEQRERNDLLEEIKTEKENYHKLHETYLDLQKEFSVLKNEKNDLETKVNILKSEDVDFEELGEALAIVKMKKQSPDSFSQANSELVSKFQQLESDHTETLKELSDTREMLTTQYKLNQMAQGEVKTLTEKQAQLEKEYQTKLEEYVRLLDVRAEKIKKLEKQLNDIAYGTKTFRIETFDQEIESIETLELDRGENIFEIHITKFTYSSDGLKVLKTNNPSSFLTWNFYEFELQSTPVVKGPNPQFGFSASYTVKVDDFFLFYLYKNSTTLELHESLGTDYHMLAACQLNFSQLLEVSNGRIHGTEQLISTDENHRGIVFGTVEYWVKLHVPMDEAFKLYKEKFKALKYIQSNKLTSKSTINASNKPVKPNNTINNLHIKITRCTNLSSRHEGVQPSPFCIYKFYDLPDQDTVIIPASNNPVFSDHRTFPLFMDLELEKYLKTENLEVYVFDDNDPDMTSYIGRASVPLLPLSCGKPIKETFQLLKNGDANGTMEVSLYWQHPYEVDTRSVQLPEHFNETIEYPSHIKSVVLPISSSDDEDKAEMQIDASSSSSAKPPVPKPRTSVSKPLKTSTPKKSFTDSSSASSSPAKTETILSGEPSPKHDIPQPAIRQSKIKLNTVDDFIAYGESFLRSPRNGNSTASPKKPPRKIVSNSPKHIFKEPYEDTMIEKKHEISFEEISDDDKQALSDSDISDDNVNPAQKDSETEKSLSSSHNAKATVVIAVLSLSLKPDIFVINDPTIKMLYVEFSFLDFPIEELETPVALPKPVPPDVATYNFVKEFDFSLTENYDKLRLLAEMFDPLNPNSSRIKFTLVSEPPSDEEDLDCEEVGFAHGDLKEILDSGNDLINKNISIFNIKNTEEEIGTLCITIKAQSVLQLLQGSSH